ncbi:MBL fold metallo-hydrolase [Roseibium sp. FZY0029]|uniref:MBL fold metallo-hydrolase n=1 Tax=Roseibium sp. FZY0029 TaxID=3116647 RepID=UPI002ECAD880|nr:MBL fold metallo-hydrolase [Roseibium sp. FZY0029]
MVEMTNKSEAVPGENERFEELGRGCYAYSADGCSNTGVVIGEKGVLIVDAQATPALAEKVLQKVRELTDKPVKQVVLTHFHADNTLGALAFEAGEIISSDLTKRMMEIRGVEEIRLARQRDAALFADLPGNTGVSMPSMTIASSMTIDLGGLDVRLMHLGRAHTMGDLVVWVPQSGVIFAGDLVQKAAVPYCGDAHFADWPRALDRITAFRPTALMPGRGKSAIGPQAVATAVETTRDFVVTLRDAAAACVEQSLGLKDTFQAVRDALAGRFGSKVDFEFHLPISVARAYDEALGLDQPQVWTRERIADLYDALAGASAASDTGADQPAEDAVETDAPSKDAAAEAPLEAADAKASDLVSDSDFAASLALGSEEEREADRDDMELSAEDIVEEDKPSDTDETASSDKASANKVLEDAR